MRLLIIIAAASMLGFHALAQSQAKGVVYDDANRNGAHDAGEAGLPGVCVSNGREVVVTGEDGTWTLPADDDCVFFVIKPAGWQTPVNTAQIPQSYYVHKPNGSPVKLAPPVPPTGPLPASIDFALYKHEEPEKFKVLVFGDTQARGVKEVDFVTHDVVEECIGADAAFGISLGDIVADDAGLFDEINDSIAQIGIPWYNTFGNHDYNRDLTAPEDADDTFELNYGPSTFAFEYGKVAFIVLNNIHCKVEGGYDAKLSDDQIAFVSNYLAHVPKDKLVVSTTHVPMVRCGNREALWALLADRPYFSIAAHTHTQMHLFLDEKVGWPGAQPHHHFISATVSGSWWCGAVDELGIPHTTMNDGGPNGYSYVTFDGVDYSIEFKAARRPADYQMNIYLPSEVLVGDVAQTEILVNVFAGSDRSVTEMRAGSDSWIALEQTAAKDPACQAMFERSQYLDQEVNGVKLDTVFGWKMDEPSMTRHMWKGTLPPLPAGIHTIEVRTTDMFGQQYHDHRIIRVVESPTVSGEG